MNKFQCRQCGCCCKLGEELLACLPLPLIAVFMPREDGSCRHLVMRNDGKYECAIYEHRPYICQVDWMAKRAIERLGLTLEEYYEITYSACAALRKALGEESTK